jgi:hypothetical protein
VSFKHSNRKVSDTGAGEIKDRLKPGFATPSIRSQWQVL